MELRIKQLQDSLCRALCENVHIVRRDNEHLIETPFTFPDGDHYQIYLEVLSTGGFRLSDGGHTLMHLSYEHDVDKFFHGSRNMLLEAIRSDFDIDYDQGAFSVVCTADDIGERLIKFGQALTKIYDVSFLHRARVAGTFYEDLSGDIYKLIPAEKVREDLVFKYLDDDRGDYPIDYSIHTSREDEYAFIFAIGSSSKAQLVNIILERLRRKEKEHSFSFKSLCVVWDFYKLPEKSGRRLINVAPMIDYKTKGDAFAERVKELAA